MSDVIQDFWLEYHETGKVQQKFSTCIHITLLTLFQRFVAKYCPYNRDCVRKFVLKALSVSGYKGVRLREQHLLRNAYALAGRRKIVRTKGVSAYEE